MSGQESSCPDKGKTYIIRVPSTIPFSSASTPPDIGSSRPSPPSTVPTPSVGHTPPTTGPTPSTIGPTPSVVGLTPPTVVPTPSIVGPTPYIHPSPIPTPSFIPSPYVHQASADPADPTDLGDPAPHDRPFIEPCGKGTMPHWVGEHKWNSLLTHWNTPQYRIKCATAQKNRASKKGGVLHTRGSITTHEHAIRMVFTQTHIRKGTGEYVDERSRKTIEDFSARLTQARPEVGSGPDGRVDTVGGKKKGRLYGVGQLASHYSVGKGGIFRHQPSTFSTFDPNNVPDLKIWKIWLTLVPQQGHTAPSSSSSHAHLSSLPRPHLCKTKIVMILMILMIIMGFDI
ncbi:hypothetical protein V8G54_000733 [Vigna mungo]|uniref:Uncharacterized protein n=1 Tax=Vigna mungo TaxID=3915 RepID=A0AAQ3SB44_VIGMU